MELPAVSFFGRTLDEYCRFFALDPAALRDRAVLDVAAGPSSFTAEARRRGVDAVAVDPLYDRSHAELAARVRDDYARMFEQMREKRRLFRFKTFPTFDAAEADRRAAASRFLADYEGNVRHGRYVRASLPLLPFLAFGIGLAWQRFVVDGGAGRRRTIIAVLVVALALCSSLLVWSHLSSWR